MLPLLDRKGKTDLQLALALLLIVFALDFSLASD